MSVRDRWYVAAMIGLPLITISAYLLWIWPRPGGTSLWAELAPYLLSLVTGLPFAWALGRRRGRGTLLYAFLGAGFALMYVYAAVVLCYVRGVCL